MTLGIFGHPSPSPCKTVEPPENSAQAVKVSPDDTMAPAASSVPAASRGPGTAMSAPAVSPGSMSCQLASTAKIQLQGMRMVAPQLRHLDNTNAHEIGQNLGRVFANLVAAESVGVEERSAANDVVSRLLDLVHKGESEVANQFLTGFGEQSPDGAGEIAAQMLRQATTPEPDSEGFTASMPAVVNQFFADVGDLIPAPVKSAVAKGQRMTNGAFNEADDFAALLPAELVDNAHFAAGFHRVDPGFERSLSVIDSSKGKCTLARMVVAAATEGTLVGPELHTLLHATVPLFENLGSTLPLALLEAIVAQEGPEPHVEIITRLMNSMPLSNGNDNQPKFVRFAHENAPMLPKGTLLRSEMLARAQEEMRSMSTWDSTASNAATLIGELAARGGESKDTAARITSEILGPLWDESSDSFLNALFMTKVDGAPLGADPAFVAAAVSSPELLAKIDASLLDGGIANSTVWDSERRSYATFAKAYWQGRPQDRTLLAGRITHQLDDGVGMLSRGHFVAQLKEAFGDSFDDLVKLCPALLD